jgi:3-hydroxyacyl-CoA dehydrogenase / 3-hydroxy-2-methylbutyryl-CoA dehydrogenase
MNIRDCIGIVTGGASGLGEACVRHLVRSGGRVAIFDINALKGEQLASEIGDHALFVKCDITNEASTEESIQKVTETFGALNILINCAGLGFAEKVASKRGPASLANFSEIIKLNLIGSFNAIRLSIQLMLNREPNEDGERGVIINTASVAAFDGQIGQAAYSASKAGIVGMTLPIARECADYGIRVLTIAPGAFDTPMLALLPQASRDALVGSIPFPKRLGRTSEFAKLVGHIIENQMLNGEVIRLDGGIRMTAR